MKEIKPLKPPILKNLLETSCDQSISTTPNSERVSYLRSFDYGHVYRDNIGEQKMARRLFYMILTKNA